MTRYTVDAARITGEWPRVELYQNTTLRYPPVPAFAARVAKDYGRPRLLRCWVTLDEVWDYRTDEYFFDYQIGVHRYDGDPNHADYDWKSTVPTNIRIQEHLKSFSENSDELMLNLRRYEVETLKGIVSLEKYEAVVEKVIEFYKDLCPNIRYIEALNEVDYQCFGGIGMDHYYLMYKCIDRAVRRLNDRHGYAMPLGIGGTATNDNMSRPQIWRQFLQNLANDRDRKIDFYSVHDYTHDPSRLKALYNMHKAWISELGLPQLPIFVDEYGFTGTTGVWTDSLKNASGVLVAMIGQTELPGLHILPWCTYHNPTLQMSFTQYLTLEDGSIVPTPNGNAMRALAWQKQHRLASEGKSSFNSAILATGDTTGTAILVTNATGKPLPVEVECLNLPAGAKTVTQYLVDATHNNLLTGPAVKEFHLTERMPLNTEKVQLSAVLEEYAFTLWLIEPAQR